MKEERTYRQLLQEFNRLMDGSGLRAYCRTQCRGECCERSAGYCTCGLGCSEKLPCVMFLCTDLQEIVLNCCPDLTAKIKYQDELLGCVNARITRVVFGREPSGTNLLCAYYESYTMADVESLRFSVRTELLFDPAEIRRIGELEFFR